MSRLYQVFITILITITFVLCGVIIWILVFKQGDIPQLSIGQKGEKGDSPTAQQIAVAVAEYMEQNPPRDGRDGQSIQGPQGEPGNTVVGPDGQSIQGKPGSSCSVSQAESGAIIACEDGTSAIVSNGSNGFDGRTPMISCGESGYWLVRYSTEDNWQLLNDEEKSCEVVLIGD